MSDRWQRRDRKQQAERKRMKKTGMSVFNIQRLQKERADRIKKEKGGE